jgi:hypothetical protein
MVVGCALRVFALGEDHALNRLSGAIGLSLFKLLNLVQPPHEEQVSDLLDHLQGV